MLIQLPRCRRERSASCSTRRRTATRPRPSGSRLRKSRSQTNPDGPSYPTLPVPACSRASSDTSLWQDLTDAILAKDMIAATEAKTAVEESQRELRRRREESGQTFVPRFFQQDKDGRWVPKFKCVPASHACLLSADLTFALLLACLRTRSRPWRRLRRGSGPRRPHSTDPPRYT